MLSKEQVQHIAKLARIGLTEKEMEKFQTELSSILDFVAKLKEVDTKTIPPTSHVIDIANVVRKDEILHDPERAAHLIEAVPEKKERYVKVKAVL